MDHLIDERMRLQNIAPSDAGSAIATLRAEIESVKKLRHDKVTEMGGVRDNAARTLAIASEIEELNSRRMTLTQKVDKLMDQQKSDTRSFDATRRKFRTEILSEADIICSTLSGAAQEHLEQLDFEIIVIDEAAQAIELSSLIPLRYHCRSCIMVGGT